MNDTTSSTNGRDSAIGSVDAVLDVLVPGVELTDAELVERVMGRAPEMHRGKVIPARIRLARKGTVELVGKNEQGHQVWHRTPSGGEEAAREAAEARKVPAEKRLSWEKPERRAQVVAALLADEEVNRLVREQTERGRQFRRARARAHEVHAETEAERRERKRRLAEEERSDGPALAFLKIRDQLRDGVNVLLDVRKFMRTEVERHNHGEPTHITPARWDSVGVNVLEVIQAAGAVWHDLGTASGSEPEHCPLCGGRTAPDPNALDEGYIDAFAEDEDDDLSSGEEGA